MKLCGLVQKAFQRSCIQYGPVTLSIIILEDLIVINVDEFHKGLKIVTKQLNVRYFVNDWFSYIKGPNP